MLTETEALIQIKVKYRPGSTPFSTRRRSRTLGCDGLKPEAQGHHIGRPSHVTSLIRGDVTV
jgi:hypothetical protein